MVSDAGPAAAQLASERLVECGFLVGAMRLREGSVTERLYFVVDVLG